MLKKLGLLILMVALLVFMAGCNLKEKIGENITEGLLEKAVGGDADIDLDDGEMKITNEDGEEMTFNDENGLTIEGEDGSVVASGGDYEWPEDQAAQYLPKIKKGKISYLFNSEDSCMLYVEEIKLDDYEDYVKDVIDQGYTEEKVESSAEDMQLYGAKSTDGVAINVIYINSESILQLSVDATLKQ